MLFRGLNVATFKTLLLKPTYNYMKAIRTKKAVRTETLRFRLTPEEHAVVMGEFKDMNVSTSVFFRQSLLPIFIQQAEARKRNG